MDWHTLVMNSHSVTDDRSKIRMIGNTFRPNYAQKRYDCNVPESRPRHRGAHKC